MSMLRLLLGLTALLAPAAVAAAAPIEWRLLMKEGRPYLQGMPTETESDTEFWALCRRGGKIEIGVGANSMVGKGEGETVSLTLLSGSARAHLRGKSRNSVNFEMTAGTELRTQVSRDDALFKVLATGKPITVSGSIKTDTWPVKDLKAKLAAFLRACR